MKFFNIKSTSGIDRMGIGDAVSDKKLIESAVKEMTTISGQKSVATY